PEVFAGGAIVAGLPYGSATNVQEAFESMLQGRSRSAAEWSNVVRAASSHQGPWPKVRCGMGGPTPSSSLQTPMRSSNNGYLCTGGHSRKQRRTVSMDIRAGYGAVQPGRNSSSNTRSWEWRMERLSPRAKRRIDVEWPAPSCLMSEFRPLFISQGFGG